MSVNHPLIKQLKGKSKHTTKPMITLISTNNQVIVLKFHNDHLETGEINDTNGALLRFCELIEEIFCDGFVFNQRRNYLLATITRKLEIFEWLATIDVFSKNPSFSDCLEIGKNSKRTQTQLGRLRLLIRACLAKKCLHAPVQTLGNSDQSLYYTKSSILGDEILIKILLSVLMQCNKINFNLNLDNASFLDITWNLPKLLQLEVVPCNSLGIGVSFAYDKAVIVNIDDNSVIAENDRVNRGDILESLNGIPLTSACKGQLRTIFRLNRNQPIRIVIIKAIIDDNSTVYPPIRKFLKSLRIDINDSSLKSRNREVAFRYTGHQAVYLGCMDVGQRGDICQIQNALKYFTTNNKLYDSERFEIMAKTDIETVLEIGDMRIKVINTGSNEVILRHSYMQISSCGSIPQLPNHFAYIAGDENCENSSKFVCYVFYVKNLDTARTILQSIGQGFHRTHFMV